MRPTLSDHTKPPPMLAGSWPRTADTASADVDPLVLPFRYTRAPTRWMGWRLRALVLIALLSCVAILALARWLASFPTIDAEWMENAAGSVELVSTTRDALRPRIGSELRGLSDAQGRRTDLTGVVLHRSGRWMTDDAHRDERTELHRRIQEALAGPSVVLHFSDGSNVPVQPSARGGGHLGIVFWFLCGLALAMLLVGASTALARTAPSSLLFGVMAASQACSLLLIATESTLDLSLPNPVSGLNMPLRAAFDLITATAAVNISCLPPSPVRNGGRWAWAAWAGSSALIAAGAAGLLSPWWWWTQGAMVVLAAASLILLTLSYRNAAHPFTLALRRIGAVSLGTWLLLTLVVAETDGSRGAVRQVAEVAPVIWQVFFASLLLLIPFLLKSQQVMREFSLLAITSTVATSLDLLFVTVFSFGQFTSLTLALFVSLGIYTTTRQWLMNQLLGSSVMTTERLFDSLYRVAREVESEPERTPALLQQLLQTLFEPLEAIVMDRPCQRPRVAEDGASLLVPFLDLAGEEHRGRCIALRFAARGRRLFTEDDARLTARVLEQLRRAIAFDRAVEQGRHEERLRIAQDLHDDIGARLLTLMYKAPSPEIEDYIRYTLHDLKTLTRGLAASQHRLSRAEIEWKTDLGQRLEVAGISFGWHCAFDEDVLLSVVQWSALTRIMRELVSNAIAHARAQRVDIHFRLMRGRLELSVVDDGIGQTPQNWSHGLGLGGIRKRVKQLGGAVSWHAATPSGIQCRVMIPRLVEVIDGET